MLNHITSSPSEGHVNVIKTVMPPYDTTRGWTFRI